MLSSGFSICLVVAVTASKLFVTSAELELQLLNVVFRHGDRTPGSYEQGELYPKDPYFNYSFPMGYRQLTNIGKMRCYTLGKHLHDLYASFLKKSYEPVDVYARTSATNRTKMSLQMVLSALFPPKGHHQRHSQLKWQPVPIFHCPDKLDQLLRPDQSALCDIRYQLMITKRLSDLKLHFIVDPFDCTRFTNFMTTKIQQIFSFLSRFQMEMNKTLQLPEVIDHVDPYKELMQNLTELTGRPITDTLDILNLYNVLTAEASLGLELPAWTKGMYPDGILANATQLQYEIDNWTPSLRKIVAGVLLRKMVDNMLDKVENHEINKKKIYLYSAYEMNVAAALIILKIWDPPHVPKYTSAVIIELLSRDTEYYVRVRHYEGIPAESSIKTIPGCMELCPLQQFINLIEDNLVSSEEARDYC